MTRPSSTLTPPTCAPVASRPPRLAPVLTPLRSSLRWPAAAAALVTAAAHLPLIGPHLAEVRYAGLLFAGLATLCVVGAVILALRDASVVWTVLGSTCLAAIAGYALSRGPGLPDLPDDVGDWADPLGLISVLAESLVVVLALVALCSTSAVARRRRPAKTRATGAGVDG